MHRTSLTYSEGASYAANFSDKFKLTLMKRRMETMMRMPRMTLQKIPTTLPMTLIMTSTMTATTQMPALIWRMN